MPSIGLCEKSFVFLLFSATLCSCSHYSASNDGGRISGPISPPPDYSTRLAQTIETSEKVVIIDPKVHAWGAYGADGNLQRAGLATAGSNWCPDIKRPCRTSSGTFRIYSLGESSCKSHIFPKPKGGAPMPYCMYFNGGQALHGSGEVVEANVSHGCVRMRVPDAEWLRFNFANVGTKVVVKPY
jgi:L,D-transpeptidase catalytic domain